mgnify:CR=1 FL=1
MKYKLLQQVVVENIIAFLDECQSEASSNLSESDSMEIVNFCNWAIKELLNAKDGISTDVDSKDLSAKEIKAQTKRWDKIDEKFFDWKLPLEMPDKDFDKMLNQFDAFLRGWEKEYNKKYPNKQTPPRQEFNTPHIEDVAEWMTLDEVKDYLKDDDELSAEEKFELYYDERERRNPKNKGFSYDELLKKSGIENIRKK